MIDYVGMVEEFHEKYNHRISSRPHTFSDENALLRYKLIDEEINDELLPAIENRSTPDIIEIADALADSLYVIFGTALSFGVPIDEVFVEVHRSNMTKSTEKNEYGKSIKGKDFQPPRIEEIVRRHQL